MKNYKFLFFSLMLMSCIIDVDTPVGVSMLSAFKENAKVARGMTGKISGAYYGSLAGLRTLTDTGVKMAYINDYGAGTFVQDPLDGSSADNTWRTIIAASGKRY